MTTTRHSPNKGTANAAVCDGLVYLWQGQDEPVASIGLTALMAAHGSKRYEVVTRWGGPSDARDIMDSEWRTWDELPTDAKREAIEHAVEHWGDSLGYIVTEYDINL